MTVRERYLLDPAAIVTRRNRQDPRHVEQDKTVADRRGTAMRGVVTAVALVTMLAGCDRSAPGPGSGTQVSETIEDVDYYYACGNEVLELRDGRRFYPFVDQDVVDEDAYVSAATFRAIAAPLVAATLAVPAPEPGDDTGTLTIYEDGTAQFVSDTGTEAWLTEEEQTYDWVC